eukprot:Gb_36540 [translate_table: standard]
MKPFPIPLQVWLSQGILSLKGFCRWNYSTTDVAKLSDPLAKLLSFPVYTSRGNPSPSLYIKDIRPASAACSKPISSSGDGSQSQGLAV